MAKAILCLLIFCSFSANSQSINNDGAGWTYSALVLKKTDLNGHIGLQYKWIHTDFEVHYREALANAYLRYGALKKLELNFGINYFRRASILSGKYIFNGKPLTRIVEEGFNGATIGLRHNLYVSQNKGSVVSYMAEVTVEAFPSWTYGRSSPSLRILFCQGLGKKVHLTTNLGARLNDLNWLELGLFYSLKLNLQLSGQLDLFLENLGSQWAVPGVFYYVFYAVDYTNQFNIGFIHQVKSKF